MHKWRGDPFADPTFGTMTFLHQFPFPARLAITAAAPALIALVVLGTADHAAAQLPGDTPTTGTTFAASDFQVRFLKPDGDDWVPMNKTDADYYFNNAHCQCDSPLQIEIVLTPAGRGKAQSVADVTTLTLRAGAQISCLCEEGQTCDTNLCTDLGSGRVKDLLNEGFVFETTVQTLFKANHPSLRRNSSDTATAICDRGKGDNQSLYLWSDYGADESGFEITDGMTTVIPLEGQPLSPPVGVKVTAGNEALEVEWSELDLDTGLQGYVVFCARAGDVPVFAPGTITARFDTPKSICPSGVVPTPAALTTATAQTVVTPDAPLPVDGQKGAAPAPFLNPDPAFACTKILTGQTKARIHRLQNGIPYVVGVASVDDFGNVSPMPEVVLQAPIPTQDFYRTYREAGGDAMGGFCAAAPGSAESRPAWTFLALALAALAWRRRQPRRRP